MAPNSMRDCTRGNTDGAAAARVLPGLILVGIGALFLLDNLHIVVVQDWFRYWPAILVALGIVKLVDSDSTEGQVVGGILFGIGGILLLQTLGFLYVRIVDLWPVLLIGIGLLLLFQRLPIGHLPTGRMMEHLKGDAVSEDMFDDVAIFGGTKRVVMSQNFKGGKITGLFGGGDIDLRKAGIRGDSAELEIVVIFGGASIRVPEHWSVVAQCPGIFGGFGDRSIHPDPERTPGMKRLYIKGAAIFGGVEVKN